MKRYIAFVMSVIMIAALASSLVYANDTVSADSAETTNGAYEDLGTGAVTFTCEYSEDAKRIEISGNVNYNILVTYGKYRLGILRIAPAQSELEAMTAEVPDIAAEMDIAAKFEMSFEADSAIEKFSKYAVVLISPEGVLSLASEPRYICVSSRYGGSSSDKGSFKGIMPSDMSEVSVSGDMGFGSAVIPVYYNRLINESMNGYMYPHEDTHCYFDKTYIDELDAKVRTYSATGARVYLQLLLPSGAQTANLNGAGGAATGAFYDMPNVYDPDTLSKIYTYVKFLVSRYSDYVNGQIGGIIVGKQIDKVKYNYTGGLSTEKYAEKYAYYLTVVANTARFENPDIDIVIPLSDFNSYGTVSAVSSGNYLPSELIENVFACLDDFFEDDFSCSAMLESDSVPLELSSSVDEDGAEESYYVASSEENGKIRVSDLSLFDSFFSRMRGKYRSASENYIYFWQIPRELSGNALECSYVYTYYSLIANSRVSSFVVSFSQSDDGVAESVKKTLSDIDTAKGTEESAKLLPYFGAEEWKDVISNYSESHLTARAVFSADNADLSGRTWLGSFSYFDFSTGGMSGWYGAAYSKGVKSDYGEGGQRVLRQTVSKPSGDAHSDLFCLYEYDENLVYTPALKFKMAVTDGEVSTGAVYEITVTIGTEGSSTSKTQIVRSGDVFEMWLDVENYAKGNKASYIKISTRDVTGVSDEYSLWVYDVSGHSGIYDSEQLDALISAERQNIRSQSQSEDGGAIENIIYWIVFFIILVAIFIGGIIIAVVRRDDGREGYKHISNKESK